MECGRTIIVGGGGFGRELFFWASDCYAAGRLPPVSGYVDDAGDVLASFDYDMPWLGSIQEFVPATGDCFVLAIGSPAGKRRIFETLQPRGGSFPRLIHPSATVVRTAKLGEGVIFCPGTLAGADTVIERFVTFNGSSGIGHDSVVGEFSTLSSNVDVTGNVVLGRDVSVGSNAVFLPKVKVGDGATVGAGSIVYRSIRPGATVYAPPAKLLKKR
jgi:sugar O-acyltransferase (sialic acid O-acetyltransferase NeuD family)